MRQLFVWPILWYISFFARLALRISHPTVIGITGSIGKSSTRNAIYALLKDSYRTKMIERGNSESGIPLGILGLNVHSLGFTSGLEGVIDWICLLLKVPFGIHYLKNTQYLIVEMGIDEPNPPKNMSYLLTIVKPDIAIILDVSSVHSMQFAKHLEKNPSQKQIITAIAHEKSKIATDNNKVALTIYDRDNPFITRALADFHKGSIMMFGSKQTNDISYNNYKVSTDKTSFVFLVKNIPSKKIDVSFPHVALPQKYREVFAPTILVGLYTGLSLKQIQTSLQNNFKIPKSRFSLIDGIRNSLLIDSSYNASPQATLSALELLQLLAKKTRRAPVFVFGDMRELGPIEQQAHEQIAQKISQTADYVYCVGPLTKQYVIPHLNSMKSAKWFENANQAGAYLQKNLPVGSLVLIKGSQNTIYLEEAIKYILKNQKDKQNLCRQDPYWIQVKKDYFTAAGY